jgi:hypothetical protein
VIAPTPERKIELLSFGETVQPFEKSSKPPSSPEAVKKFRQGEGGSPGNEKGFSLHQFEFFPSFPFPKGEKR